MDTGKFVGLLVFGLVGILVLSAFIPILTETTSATDTLENDGYFHMEKYDTDTNITMVWDHTVPKQITVNGISYNPQTPINQFVSVAIGDNWYFRYADGGSNVFVQATYGGVDHLGASTTAGTDLTLVCENGTCTVTLSGGENDPVTKTVSYTELYVISGDSGDYVMKNANETVYAAGNTEFVAVGSTALGETGKAVLKVNGDIDNGATVDVIGSSPIGATVSNIEVNAIELTDYVGYALSTVTFTVTAGGTDYPATYSYFIVPAEVTLERSIHMDSALATIINLLPLIAGVGLLMFLVAEFLYTRYL